MEVLITTALNVACPTQVWFTGTCVKQHNTFALSEQIRRNKCKEQGYDTGGLHACKTNISWIVGLVKLLAVSFANNNKTWKIICNMHCNKQKT